MSAKRRDELDLVQYRLDALERRIESVERALLSKNDSGSINTELLNIVLNMVRGAPATTASSPKQQESLAASTPQAPEQQQQSPQAATQQECSTIGRSFMFDRRKTVV